MCAYQLASFLVTQNHTLIKLLRNSTSEQKYGRMNQALDLLLPIGFAPTSFRLEINVNIFKTHEMIRFSSMVVAWGGMDWCCVECHTNLSNGTINVIFLHSQIVDKSGLRYVLYLHATVQYNVHAVSLSDACYAQFDLSFFLAHGVFFSVPAFNSLASLFTHS